MKIAFVSNFLEATGGDDILLHHVKGLRKAGHDITAFFYDTTVQAVEKYGQDTLSDLITVGMENCPYLEAFDLVVANGLFGANSIKDLDINKAFFLQNFDPIVFPDKKEDIKEIYAAFDKFLLYSSDLQELVKQHSGDKTFVKCNNGVDFKSLAAHRTKKCWDKSVCFVVAYYLPYKGIKFANQVFGMLKDKGWRTVEICSTNGPLDNTMEFYRNPSFERKCEIMSSCEIMLHPSIFETWNLVSMESMALGTPVVGTNSKGIKEYADDSNSIILDKRDPELIVEQIERLSEDAELKQKLIQNGYKTARAHDWEKIMPSIIECYEKLI